MIDKPQAVARLRQDLGQKPLNRTWAKLEVLLGLAAAGLGLLLGVRELSHPMAEFTFGPVLAFLALFVLGGYLALAGHRSHLYQSANELTAYLAELIRNQND